MHIKSYKERKKVFQFGYYIEHCINHLLYVSRLDDRVENNNVTYAVVAYTHLPPH